MPYDICQVNNALGELGYEVIDADQWGQSYRHGQDYDKTCELDELEYGDKLIRLILREADVSEPDITDAENRLIAVYENIYRICQDKTDEYQYATLLTTESLSVELQEEI